MKNEMILSHMFCVRKVRQTLSQHFCFRTICQCHIMTIHVWCVCNGWPFVGRHSQYNRRRNVSLYIIYDLFCHERITKMKWMNELLLSCAVFRLSPVVARRERSETDVF